MAGNGGYDVQSYDIDLSWEPTSGRIDETTVIVARATQSLSQFNLDLSGLDVDRIQVDGSAAAFSRLGTELVMAPATPLVQGSTFTTTVHLTGVPQIDQTGGWFRDPHGGVIVFGEPDGPAGWYPVNDHPLDKATYTVRVTAPSTMTVAANGDLDGKEVHGATTTWTYADRFPQASYLTTVAIGDYEIVDGGTSRNGVKIRNVFPRSRVQELTASFAQQPQMIDAFETDFGPYPFDVYGALVIDGFDPGGALEIQTMSVFGNATSDGSVIPHELAHQWFGDSVSLRQWKDIWLNEGFATYAELLWQQALDPSFDITQEIRSQVAQHRIDRPITQVDATLNGLFNESVYTRGSYLLHALRLEIGDPDFFTVLHRWTSDHRAGNVDTAEFIALAEEVSGKQLGDLFDRWLNADPMPNDFG